jgi:hypothetical protein
MLIIGKCLEPFEHIVRVENVQPLRTPKPLKHHKLHKPLKHFLFFNLTSPS